MTGSTLLPLLSVLNTAVVVCRGVPLSCICLEHQDYEFDVCVYPCQWNLGKERHMCDSQIIETNPSSIPCNIPWQGHLSTTIKRIIQCL
jgi:hypothetical protein